MHSLLYKRILYLPHCHSKKTQSQSVLKIDCKLNELRSACHYVISPTHVRARAGFGSTIYEYLQSLEFLRQKILLAIQRVIFQYLAQFFHGLGLIFEIKSICRLSNPWIRIWSKTLTFERNSWCRSDSILNLLQLLYRLGQLYWWHSEITRFISRNSLYFLKVFNTNKMNTINIS